MKISQNLYLILTLFLLVSCTVSEKNWHEAASKIKSQSIYIKKDGVISAKIDNRISDDYKLNISDAGSADITYGAMRILYKEHKLEYDNFNKIDNNVFILDLRNGFKNIEEYRKIISKEKNKETQY